MEFTQLNQFRITAETKNISEASIILGISQSTLTKSIQNLESELGITLFDRTGRKLSLTKNGLYILSYVNKIYSNIEFMIRDTYMVNNEKMFRICSSISSIMTKIPLFNEKYPETEIYPQLRSSEYFKEYLLRNIFDVVISTWGIEDTQIKCTKTFTDHMWASIPYTNALSEKDLLKLEDLKWQTVIITSDMSWNPLQSILLNKIKEKKININFYVQASINACEVLASGSDYIFFVSSIDLQNPSINKKRKYILVDPAEGILQPYYVSYMKKNNKVQEINALLQWVNYACSFKRSR